MARKKRSAEKRYVQPYRYPSPNIPMSAIRRFARRIAEKFRPDQIILFGSYAYGTPHEESDVDLLVVMPASDVVGRAVRIINAFDREFSYELIVRTPRQIERGLQQNDWFLREIVEKGKVLYDARNRPVGPVRRGRLGRGQATGGQSPPLRNLVCFHCQQSAEKYLKALLQETGLMVPRTHDLEHLLDLVVPADPSVGPLRRALRSLSQYAVEYRYPGARATTRRMQAALRQAERVRSAVRARLGLPP